VKIEEIQKLIRLLEESDVAEIEIRRWWGKIRVSKNSHANHRPEMTIYSQGYLPGAPGPAPAEGRPPSLPEPPAEAAPTAEIRSPMVGTFYRAPAPDAEPYIEVGSMVSPGQTVCIIEAMKLMNEIQSEVRGRIARVLVENGKPVEFGQPLFLVEESK
jgi:acetyl-CoA carboxylase biotin carboxyl carrier protein